MGDDDVYAWIGTRRLTRLSSLTDFYEAYFSSGKEARVIQVGANDGIMCDPLRRFFLYSTNQKIRAVLVEPIPFYYAKLQTLYADNPNITLLNVACGASRGRAPLYFIEPTVADQMNGDGPPNNWAHGQGSFDLNVVKYWIERNRFRGEHYIRNMDKYTESIISINVEIICLSDVEMSNDNDDLLLVIDVQGFELDVIRGLDWRYPPAYIVVEDDLNKSGSINKYLSAKGYFYLCGRIDKVYARTPGSLPALLLKNLKYAFASRRPSYWNELGRGFSARERYEEALACYDHALAIRGDIPQIWTNRGRALQNLDRLDEAETSLREALRLKPSFANAHCELGVVLDCLGRFEEAEASVRTALRLEPEHAFAHFNLGQILYNLGRTSEAEASYRTALRLRPDSPVWHASLGLALLLAGKFEEGWREFEWRWQTKYRVRVGPRFPFPSWNGEAIGDRVILLFADEGLGDALQFCRYVPQVAARGGRLILAVQPALVRLLSRLPGASEIVATGSRPPSFDLWCALFSLPHAVGTTLETIPATTPYLTADPADVAHWRKRLAGFAGLQVGLCWAGGRSSNLSQIVVDRRRSLTLDALALLGEVPGVQFISLQKGPPAAEAARPPRGLRLHDFAEDLHDFADTAALIDNLDLVISVDTAVAHLAGALGKPVWVLNRFDTCFRWPRNREDSPWYPSSRQFRQPTPGDWASVISRAQGALQRLVEGDHSQLRPPMQAS
jgi:FkbM family methyltransferase